MEWISTKDRTPPLREYILVYAENDEVHKDSGPRIFAAIRGDYQDEEYSSAWGDGWIPYAPEDIKYWMPLPKPPAEEGSIKLPETVLCENLSLAVKELAMFCKEAGLGIDEFLSEIERAANLYKNLLNDL